MMAKKESSELTLKSNRSEKTRNISRDVTISIVLFTVLSTSLHAQGWEQIYPPWEANVITDLLHWNGDTVFACGHEWTLMRSVDNYK